MSNNAPLMSFLEWMMLLALALVWGGSFFFAAIAVAEVPPLSVAWLRVTGAALVLFLAVKVMGLTMRLDARIWRAFFGMGILNNVIPFSLIFWAQMELASGVASILNAMTPVFTVIAAHYLTQDERMTRHRLAGVVLGFVGVFVLIGTPVGGGMMAQLAVLCAAVSYALASIFGKRFAAMGVKPMQTATGQVTASAVVLLPIVLLMDQPWQMAIPSATTIWAIAGLATVSTAFAYFLYFRILSTAGATNVGLVTLLIPAFAIGLGVVFLNETLSTQQSVGLAVIVLGLIVIDGRVFRRFGRRPKS